MAPRPTPTKAELTILRALWALGRASTVREIHEHLVVDKPAAYTTTLKLVQIMTAKGLTVREERGPQHLYRPRDPEDHTQRRLIDELRDRAFGGSTARLVIQALAGRHASPEELDDIRKAIAAAKKAKE
jgi:BlaI family transcriptional regulator, penicillinase repressor